MTFNKKQHKTFSNSKHKNNKQHDSKTFDVSRVLVHDSRLTVRVNSKLKEAILRFCKARGESVCHLFETLFIGYLRGYCDKLDLDVKSPTINLTVVREVKRVRRYAVEEVVESEFGKCFYCPKDAVGKFRYLKTGEVFPLCSFHGELMLDSGVWEVVKDE